MEAVMQWILPGTWQRGEEEYISMQGNPSKFISREPLLTLQEGGD
jgi:hypothetical protein